MQTGVAGFVTLALLLAPVPLYGQRGRMVPRSPSWRPPPSLGIRGGFDFDAEQYAVGGQVRMPLAPLAEVLLSGDYYLAGDTSAWQLNLDLATGAMLPGVYAGAGAALARRAFLIADTHTFPKRTKLGLSLFVGATLPPVVRLPVRPFAEARWTQVSGFDLQFAVVAGVSVPLGDPAPPRRPAAAQRRAP